MALVAPGLPTWPAKQAPPINVLQVIESIRRNRALSFYTQNSQAPNALPSM